MLLLDTNILIDVLRGGAVAFAWLEQQQSPLISVITWIEVLVGCR
jgi:predicted nucleic acid-binding protein